MGSMVPNKVMKMRATTTGPIMISSNLKEKDRGWRGRGGVEVSKGEARRGEGE